MLFLSVIENDIVKAHLEELYLMYAKELVYTSYRIIHDYHEAEDIVQTAFIKVSTYIGENTDVKCNKIRGLLVIIVRRLSYNVYNKRKKQNNISIDLMEDTICDDKILSPETNILRLDDRKKIADMLDSINKNYMDILTLKYVYDFSDGVIAKLLDTTEGNVRTKLSRARKACLKIMGGEKDEG